MRLNRLLGMFCNLGRGHDMETQDTIHIGHSGDAVNLLDQVLAEDDLDPDIAKVLEAIKDALARGII